MAAVFDAPDLLASVGPTDYVRCAAARFMIPSIGERTQLARSSLESVYASRGCVNGENAVVNSEIGNVNAEIGFRERRDRNAVSNADSSAPPATPDRRRPADPHPAGQANAGRNAAPNRRRRLESRLRRRLRLPPALQAHHPREPGTPTAARWPSGPVGHGKDPSTAKPGPKGARA